jgi:hypothetical protein
MKVLLTVPRFVTYAKENRRYTMSQVDYWKGVLETCEYFRDELGVEDAMDSNMATWAVEALKNG